MVVHRHREVGSRLQARRIAHALSRGHIHRDEHLAGTLIGRRGHKTVEAGQEGQIARGLLLAGEHADALFPHLPQGGG